MPPARNIPARDAEQLLKDGHILLDVRTHLPFGGAHIVGAYNIWYSPMLSTWSGWLLPYDHPILLLLENKDQCDEVVRQLLRVGLDDVSGHVDGGMSAWVQAGLPFVRLPQLSVHELNEMLSLGETIKIVDVRTAAEYDDGHIAGAMNTHAGEIKNICHDLQREAAIATVCGGGNRSSIAASILQQHGVTNAYNVAGGMTAWVNSGYNIDNLRMI